MGGDISVKSEVGKGSVFSFFVDFKEGDKTTLTEIIQNKVVGFKKTNGDINILVADDVDKNRKVIVTLLNLVGFKTIEAVNGEDAITKFEKYNLHLILMDMRMPVMTGYEAIQFIKSTAKGKNIPIIALTASSFEDERRNIDRLGIQGYIRKPFRENELFNAIGNILEIRYIYESESVESTIEDSLLEEQVVEKLKRLPTEMTQEMNDAIEIADFERLIALIERISLEDKELSVHLLLFANNYDYNYFNTLLTQIR
jgi:CheY-like chemotaxis protein